MDYRGAAGAGATGASAPVVIEQRVRRTRPQNDYKGLKNLIFHKKHSFKAFRVLST